MRVPTFEKEEESCENRGKHYWISFASFSTNVNQIQCFVNDHIHHHLLQDRPYPSPTDSYANSESTTPENSDILPLPQTFLSTQICSALFNFNCSSLLPGEMGLACHNGGKVEET